MKDRTADRVSDGLALFGVAAIVAIIVMLLASCQLTQPRDPVRDTVDGARPLIFHTQGLD